MFAIVSRMNLLDIRNYTNNPDTLHVYSAKNPRDNKLLDIPRYCDKADTKANPLDPILRIHYTCTQRAVVGLSF